MTLISALNLRKSFGDVDVFSNLSVSIPPNARIGFVGQNGSGKTTLLRILADMDTPDAGTVSRAKNLSIGYLPQQIDVSFEKSAYDLCLDDFQNLFEIQNKLNFLEKELQEDPDNQNLIDDFGRVQHQFENSGGYHYKNQIDQVLQGLGLKDGEEKRVWNQLSGGQRIRAYLAKIILSNPDILILDEPTNHLDIYAIEWLESFVKGFPGAILMVSHDRYFLDQCVTVIWEMTPVFAVYRGNYSAYLTQREERYTRIYTEFERQQEFIQKEEEYIRRNIAGQNTRQAQGRRKRLESLLRDAKITKPLENRSMAFKLSAQDRSGDIVLKTKDLKIGYQDDQKVLFSVPDLMLIRGECAAIIGPNGTGKSTFLKTILGKMEPLQGDSILGAALKIGYFAQAHEDLDPNNTLMDEISKVAPNMLPAQIRDYLAKYLFSGDDVFKKISVISGGERGRLSLAILALQGANLLLLDEPMNHLDIDSQELLQSVLKQFEGTIILVSHDRYLIDGIATQIWEVFPQEHALSVFEGTYSQYKEEKKTIQESQTKIVPRQTTDRPQQETPKISNNELRQLHSHKDELEKEISYLEKELADLSAKMNLPHQSYDDITEFSVMYNKKQVELDTLFEEWSALADKLSGYDL